jgi:hypothetical protein
VSVSKGCKDLHYQDEMIETIKPFLRMIIQCSLNKLRDTVRVGYARSVGEAGGKSDALSRVRARTITFAPRRQPARDFLHRRSVFDHHPSSHVNPTKALFLRAFIMADDIVIDKQLFHERLGNFVGKWKTDKRSGDQLFLGASSIASVVGKPSEQGTYMKPAAFQVR